jgi:iron complex outermembrane recepter protein
MLLKGMTRYFCRPFRSGAIRCVLTAAFVLPNAHTWGADTSASTTAVDESHLPELEEITVTAQRREESLNKVPVSITALSQKNMDDLRIRTLSDLARIVPGLVLSTPVGGIQDLTDIAIRGIFSGGNAPTTELYIDETPVAIRTLPAAGPATSPRPLIFDLDRVEVLRGPQGTMFGSGAMGGAIRFITPQPDLNDVSGYAKADLSYTDRGAPNYEAGMAYGAPIVTGTAAIRVSAWLDSQRGFIDKENPYTGEILERNANSTDSYAIRPAFTWAPAEGVTITPALFLQHLHSDNPNSYWITVLPHFENGAHVSGAIDEPSNDDLNVSSVAIKYNLPRVSLASDTSYLDRHSDAINDFTHASEFLYSGNAFVPGLSASWHNYLVDSTYTHAIQQEFRLSSQDPSAKLTWVAGLYYRHALQGVMQCLPGSLDPLTEAIAGENTQQFTGFPDYTEPDGQVCNAYTNFRTTDISEAAFVNITFEIVKHLKADVGVRLEHAVVEHQNQVSAGPLDGLSYANQTLPDQIGNPVTPRYGLTYQYTDEGMVYLSAAKGYRSGGGNGATAIGNPLCTPSLTALGLATVPASYSSDGVWSYEAGAKDALFNRRLTLEASAFLIDWSNIQTSVNLPSCAQMFTANRGRATSQGFDLQLAAIITDGLKIGATVGYTDAYYPDAAFGAPVGGIPPLLNGAGDKLANVLPWTAAANVEYSRDISPLWGHSRSYIRVDYSWLSAANATNPATASYDPETSPYQNQAYGVLNLRLGVVHAGLDVSVYIANATNSDPVLGYAHDVIGDPMFYGTAIRPLTAGFTGYYRF